MPDLSRGVPAAKCCSSRKDSRMTAPKASSAFSDLREDLTRMPLKEMGKRAFKKIGDDDVPTLSAAFAYQWVFSIPPMLILIVLIAALLNKVTSVPVVEDLRDLISDRAPADSREMLLRL